MRWLLLAALCACSSRAPARAHDAGAMVGDAGVATGASDAGLATGDASVATGDAGAAIRRADGDVPVPGAAGGGSNAGAHNASPPLPHDRRCTIRVSKSGISVDGDTVTRQRALSLCKVTSAAVVNLADDRKPGVWEALKHDLDRAHVRILMRGEIGDHDCMNNPLAKGCN